MKKLEDYVLTIPDFPEKGIMFRDVTSVLQDADGLHLAIDTMQDLVKDLDFDVVAGAESRGFIFGTPIAYNMHKPFVLIRKKGKLPRETVSVDYDLEYGKATIEMHKDSIKPGQKVLVVDDLIATGGTTEAMIASSMSSCLILFCSNRFDKSIPYSSDVRGIFVVIRKLAITSSPRNTPTVIFVFPTSIVITIVFSYLFLYISDSSMPIYSPL